MHTVAVEFHNVTKRYRNKVAVKDLTLSLHTGEVVAILGPNGAGKSTSISMMLGLQRPTEGTVRLLGSDPTKPSSRIHVGAMLQQVTLPPLVRVDELIATFRSYYPRPLPTSRLLELAGLEDAGRTMADKLSGGQRRRLQFALAMAGDPQVLFLDEPTTAMDVTSRRAFWESLRQFAREEDRTVLFSTHHLDEVDQMADRVVMLHGGRCIADGSPAEIKQMTGFRTVSFYVGNVPNHALEALPAVRQMEQTGDRVALRTSDSDAVLHALFAQALDVHDIEVSSGALEDAFVSLTSDSDTQEVVR